MKIRTRYAPSPTGNIHIGGARSALFGYLFAKANGGSFIVRIEDTDIARNIEGGEKSQIDNLEWIGITPDESPQHKGEFGPYRQLERSEFYKKYTQELINKSMLYKCFCTSDELADDRERQLENDIRSPQYSKKCSSLTQEEIGALERKGKTFSWRFRVPTNIEYKWDDIVRGQIKINSKEIGDWVAIKSNGIPTYNFAVVADDIEMEMSHIFRGEEHITNTPRQLMLYDAFEKNRPLFGHLTIITNHEGKKLSKRDESIMQFVSQYKEAGCVPEAFLNFLALLGWHPGSEEEIFSKGELISIFDEKRLSKAPSVFDQDKLKFFSNSYIKRMSDEEYLIFVKPFITIETNTIESVLDELLLIYKPQISFAEELNGLIEPYTKVTSLSKESKDYLNENDSEDVKVCLEKELETLTDWTIENLTIVVNNIKDETGKKGKDLFMPLRILTTGQMKGPDLKTVIKILGKTNNILRRN